MAISVVMPALEMAQDTGKLLSWRKKEGERVSKGEPLLEVETDKAVVEVESPGDGILAGVTAHEGAVIPVGKTIAWLVQPGEKPPVEDRPAASAAPATATPAAASTLGQSKSAAAGISPKARRLAQERGIDLGQLRGSGASGEILAADVMAAAASVPAKAPATSAEAGGRFETPGQIGRLMAERTAQSWTSVPHFFVFREIDAGALNSCRNDLLPAVEKSHGVKLTHTDLLVGLVARALRKHVRLNATWMGERIRHHDEINIGLAVAVEDGIVTIVVREADKCSPGQIAEQRREMAERARAGRSRPGDLTGGTFTISNLGMYDVDAFTAIIVQPQAAILAVGKIADRVVALDGKPAVRPVITLSLSVDHRVADGAKAAMFMQDLAEAIANPKQSLQ
jgi:pyruvate dehydrogenase E2 component (dihydrolipoamide acetyltransferase)